MPFDVFALRNEVVGEYRDYFESFVNILDPRVQAFVRDKLAEGELWPPAVLQLNPSYAPGPKLGDLASAGVILLETARFFGPSLITHQHQHDAIAIAQRGESYVVSTGTGSGKSLTYLIPLVDHILRREPHREAVRAIIVYPTNALINSQLEALTAFRDTNWPDAPIRFARYTGQDRKEHRDEILAHPPHILLTNYVMLEYMLLRPYERSLVQQATRDLRFLILDELHVYRGRQGADVAMLVRRLRQRTGNPELQLVGTSATLATDGKRDERRARIAEVASTIFGLRVPPDNVVDETLKQIATKPAPATPDALRAAVQEPPPHQTEVAVASHSLAAWVEETFGLAEEDGRLVRQAPKPFDDGLRALAEGSGLPEDLCRERLKALLDAGNAARTHAGDPVFAFRLHQFFSSGGSVFATAEEPDQRELTMDGQYAVRSREEDAEPRLLFPLAFCRECGQEHYLVSLIEEGAAQHLDEGGQLSTQVRRRVIPRPPLLNALQDETPGQLGFLSREQMELWADDEDLPESWYEQRAAGPRLRDNYREHVPKRYWVKPEGTLTEEATPGAVEAWFQPRPLLLCLRCRAAYDRRDSDFRKLSTLSQTGRSTATTILSSGAVVAMRASAEERAASKVLSFTDNRQDASLQAGHLNDFMQVAMLRGAVVRALAKGHALTFDTIGQEAFEALALEPAQFMKEPPATGSGPGVQRARKAMVDLFQYRAFEDLRRAWRVAQPNLEQCGLLRIEYDGLADLAARDDYWAGAPGIGQASAARREELLRAVLDHLRSVLAIDAACLKEERGKQIKQRTEQLKEPWAIDEHERMRRAAIALLPGVHAAPGDEPQTISLGSGSAIGRFLRSLRTWGSVQDLTAHEVEDLVRRIVEILKGNLLTVVRRGTEDYGVQLMAAGLLWQPGSGEAAGPDRVRARALYLRKETPKLEPNRYFERLYRDRAPLLVGVVGAEHHGATDNDDRIAREDAFRKGELAALFCSPTMELGIDVSDLSTVHMRNVPPTPANYAQRSGRAGRGGKPALVLAFCSQGNAHDQYFFRRRGRMISGAVPAARMDLANEELVEAHLHSVWLGIVGLSLGNSIADLLDLTTDQCALKADLAAQLQVSAARQSEVIAAFRQVVGLGATPITSASWYSDAWLEARVREAPAAFDRAFDRWRELYRAAVQERDEARRRIDQRGAPREREAAEQREREAKREIDLLFNQVDITESEFYPYRYLASEGFLPGYNFPRLPLRALVSVGDKSHAIDRARFLGLTEFGPHNIVYHEGRKHRITTCIVPAGGLDARLTQARVCLTCGYIHPAQAAFTTDRCEHCDEILDAHNSAFPQALFEQPTVRGWRWERISSEEEERVRTGYDVSTHFRFGASGRLRRAEARTADGETLLAATLAPGADLWRINHGWRRTGDQAGFILDRETGRWTNARALDDDDTPEPAARRPLAGVKTYVTDKRNVLLLRPEGVQGDEAFLKTLGYALQRGIQFVYQVEEHEVAIQLIGREAQRRLLFWESAEGGIGVWERLLSDPRALAEIAQEALRVCHCDPATGQPDHEWEDRCALACYECLLSYSNQIDHRDLDRHLVAEYLAKLANAGLVLVGADRGYDEQYAWLLERVDPASDGERKFVQHLFNRRLRLPDQAQNRPEPEVAVQPDFYYQRDGLPGVCVFVDGGLHDDPTRAARDRSVREQLADRGYRVIVIRTDQPFDDQITRYAEVFGSG